MNLRNIAHPDFLLSLTACQNLHTEPGLLRSYCFQRVPELWQPSPKSGRPKSSMRGSVGREIFWFVSSGMRPIGRKPPLMAEVGQSIFPERMIGIVRSMEAKELRAAAGRRVWHGNCLL